MHLRHGDDGVGVLLHLGPEGLGGQRQHLGAPGLHLHHVAHGLVEQRRIGAQGHHQCPLLDQGDGAVLELAGGVGLGVDIADLLELQGALQAHGVVQVPADEEDGVVIEVSGGKIGDVLGVIQELLHQVRQGLDLGDDGVVLLGIHGPQLFRQVQAHQVHQHQLGGVGLGGGHGDFGAGPGVEHVVGVPGDGGAHHVDDGQGPAAPALGLPHGGHGVQSLAGLADDDDQGLFIHQRVAVAELAGQHHLHRAAHQLFPVVLADHTHVIAGAAGDDEDAGDLPDVVLGHVQVVQHHPAVPDAGRDGLADGLGLLHDLLEHEVRIAALLGGGHVPVHLAVLLLHRHQLVVEHIHGVGGQDGDLAVVHISDLPGVLQHGGHVGGDIVAALAVADDEGTVLPGGDQGVGIVGTDDAQGVGALDPAQAAAHGLQHIAALVVVELQQLGHHLGVRIGVECDAQLLQVLLQLQIVLDNAVVDQGDLAVLADMGVGVGVVGLAVGGPAGMANAQSALQIGAAVDHVGEHLETALGLFHLEAAGLRAHRHAGGVVAPVLHPGKALQQDRGGRLPAHKSNNSAHIKEFLLNIQNFISRGPDAQPSLPLPRSRSLCCAVARVFPDRVTRPAGAEGHPPSGSILPSPRHPVKALSITGPGAVDGQAHSPPFLLRLW